METVFPPPGYVKVAKPHLSKGELCWRCEGILGSIAFGSTPDEAYHAWARLLSRPVQRKGHRHENV